MGGRVPRQGRTATHSLTVGARSRRMRLPRVGRVLPVRHWVGRATVWFMRAVAFLLGLAWLVGVPEPRLPATGSEPSLLDTGPVAGSSGFVTVPGLAALPDLQDVPTGPMPRRVLGVLAELAPDGLLDLRRCASPQKPGDLAGGTGLQLRRPERRHLGVVRTPSGDLVAAEAGSGGLKRLQPLRGPGRGLAQAAGFDLAGVGLPRGCRRLAAAPRPEHHLGPPDDQGADLPGDELIFNPAERDLARGRCRFGFRKVTIRGISRGSSSGSIHRRGHAAGVHPRRRRRTEPDRGTANCGNEP